MSRQRIIPTTVGVSKAIMVHLLLFVSFLMVSRVVEQGQWHRENIIVFIAVIIVHPSSTSKLLSCDRSLSSTIVPVFI